MPPTPSQRHLPLSSGSPRGATRPPWVAAAAVATLFVACAWPLIASNNLLGRAAFDQLHYHEPTIRAFAAQWPRPDLSDYRSATTPGYHLLLSLVCRFITPSGAILQLAASFFTISLLALLAWSAARAAAAAGNRRPAATAIVLTLPLLASIYVFFPGVWLIPDNLGWLLVLAVALLAHQTATRGLSAPRLVAGAILLLAVVLVRQSHLWVAGLLWLGAWLGAAPIGDGRIADTLTRPALRIRALFLAIAATVPAILILLYFRGLWHGLTPPTFAHQYRHSLNPATPAFVLALVALFSVFFGGFIAPAAWRAVSNRPRAVLLTMVLAALIAAIPETTYLHEERSTGLWNLVRGARVIAGHTSIVLLIAAPLGAWALWGWFSALNAHARWLFLGALTAFTAAQTANPICWQRYIEPLLLLAMALGAAAIPPADSPGRARGLERLLLHASLPVRALGPLVLAALFALLTLRSLINPDVPWNTEIGPDGRRRVVGGVLVIPGVRMEEQEHRIPRPIPTPPEPAPRVEP